MWRLSCCRPPRIEVPPFTPHVPIEVSSSLLEKSTRHGTAIALNALCLAPRLRERSMKTLGS